MKPSAPAVRAHPRQDVLEERLDALLPGAELEPRTIHRAMRHAVFPGGKRVRPRLLLAVASACGASGAAMELALHAACAIELIHSASLIHDDLPCFDDASQRRGRPTTHKLYGEAIAVLAGDALLTRAFELMAETPPEVAPRALHLVRLLGQATGSREGIIGGQSLEQKDPSNPAGGSNASALAPDLLDQYHAMKTGALFRMAAEAGAAAAGAPNASAWAEVGASLGLAYQLADDLYDTYGRTEVDGKPVGQDLSHGRPNAVSLSGEHSTRARLRTLLETVKKNITQLAVDPEPLLSLMERLGGHFLKTTAAP